MLTTGRFVYGCPETVSFGLRSCPLNCSFDFFYLQKEIILHEPHEALYGGLSGLDIIKLFLSVVSKYLNKNGMFVIEFGKGQDILLKQELLRFNFNKACFYKDLNNVNRLVCVKKDT